MPYHTIAFLFPGQGSQVIGMGLDFYTSFATAKHLFEEGDHLLERPLSKIIFEGPSELLTETRNSQAGIFLTSLAILKVIQEQFPDLKPQVCAGLSLGEYTALAASQKVPFSEALPLVQFRGSAMNEACLQTQGTMAALFGLSATEVEKMVLELNLPNDLWVANFNCPGQTVISGTMKGVEEGSKEALKRGAKRVIPLKVHGAFHSGLMKQAKDKLKDKIEALHFKKSEIDLVMNVPGNFVREDDLIRKYLVEQVTSPVRWEQSIKAMEKVDLFIEIGCGRTLAGLNKQMGLQAPTISINKVADLELLT